MPSSDGQERQVKTCTKCQKTKDVSEFSKAKKSIDGLQYYCKSCTRAYAADYRKRNAAKVNAYLLKWRKENPEQYKAQQKRWDKEKIDAANRRNQHRRRGAPFTPEAVEYMEILKGDPCVFCGAPYETVEHIIAVTKGGSGNWDNLASACASCNPSKGNKELLHYMLYRLDRDGAAEEVVDR